MKINVLSLFSGIGGKKSITCKTLCLCFNMQKYKHIIVIN